MNESLFVLLDWFHCFVLDDFMNKVNFAGECSLSDFDNKKIISHNFTTFLYCISTNIRNDEVRSSEWTSNQWFF